MALTLKKSYCAYKKVRAVKIGSQSLGFVRVENFGPLVLKILHVEATGERNAKK